MSASTLPIASNSGLPLQSTHTVDSANGAYSGIVSEESVSQIANRFLAACRDGQMEQVEALLQLYPNGLINVTDSNGVDGLIVSIQKNHTKTAMLLLKYGIATTARSLKGNSALMYAAASGNDTIIQAICDIPVNPSVVFEPAADAHEDSSEDSLVASDISAVINQWEPRAFSDGLEKSHTVSICTSTHSQLPIQESIEKTEIAIPIQMSAAAFRINAVNQNGDTALLFACRGGHRSCIRLLLKHGAVMTANNDGLTPFMCATLSGPHILQMLLLEHTLSPLLLLSDCNHRHVLHFAIEFINTSEHDAPAEHAEAGAALLTMLLLTRASELLKTSDSAKAPTPLSLLQRFASGHPIHTVLHRHLAPSEHERANRECARTALIQELTAEEAKCSKPATKSKAKKKKPTTKLVDVQHIEERDHETISVPVTVNIKKITSSTATETNPSFCDNDMSDLTIVTHKHVKQSSKIQHPQTQKPSLSTSSATVTSVPIVPIPIQVIQRDRHVSPASTPELFAAASIVDEDEVFKTRLAQLYPAAASLDLSPAHFFGLNLVSLSGAQLTALELAHRSALQELSEVRLQQEQHTRGAMEEELGRVQYEMQQMRQTLELLKRAPLQS